MTGRQVIPDEKLPALMNVIYNKWFSKWRNRSSQLAAGEWDECYAEAMRIMQQGDEYPIVRNLIVTFLYELAARIRGEYTEVERDKLLEIIEKHDGRRESQ